MAYDVIVVGGGISGTMAAISAGRGGAKVLLIDSNGYLGGTLTACGVGPMMTFHAGEKQVVKGITDEVIQRLAKKGLSPGHIFDTTGYTYTVTPFDAEGLKFELEEMARECGVHILYHTMLAGVETSDGNISRITICNKAGLSTLTAKIYIDATGDADLSSMSGVGCSVGREEDGKTQPMSMMLRVNHVDVDVVREYIKNHEEEFPRLEGDLEKVDRSPRLSIGGFVRTLARAQKAGDISFPREDVLFFETNAHGEFIINTSRVIGHNNLDPISLSHAEWEGRKQAWQLYSFMKREIPGFAEARLMYIGPNIGVRSSRQIHGNYTLTERDVAECRTFPDSIAYSGYPVDIHPADGVNSEEHEEQHRQDNKASWGQIRSLPYRCLVNPVINNLITVGRCVSVSYFAQGAFRTAPIAGAIGHAGGAAALLAVQTGRKVADIDIDQLRKLLKSQGAVIF